MKKVVFIGQPNGEQFTQEVMDNIKQVFPDVDVLVMTKEIADRTHTEFVRLVANWEDKKTMAEWKADPENAVKVNSFVKTIQPFVLPNKWYSLKEVVAMNFGDYKEVKGMMDLLFAFGFVCTSDEIEKGKTMYKFTIIEEDRIAFLQTEIGRRLEEIDVLKEAMSQETAKLVARLHKPESDDVEPKGEARHKINPDLIGKKGN
jgi:hypothetical protein